jgi:hypothetical protein
MSAHKRELIEAFKDNFERYGPTWRESEDAIVELLAKHHIKSAETARALGKQLGRPPSLPASGSEN